MSAYVLMQCHIVIVSVCVGGGGGGRRHSMVKKQLYGDINRYTVVNTSFVVDLLHYLMLLSTRSAYYGITIS